MSRKWIRENWQDIIETAKIRAKVRGQKRNLSHLEYITSSPKYCEPGYTTPENGIILFANWNGEITNAEARTNKTDVMHWIASLFERAGIEMEWNDEWTTCGDCGGAVRTSGDCYGWKRSYWQTEDCDIVCHECVKKRPTDYLQSLEGNHKSGCTIDINLAEHGYHKVGESFENGFHAGQDADPKLVAKQLQEMGVERFIFTIDTVGQFDIEFSVHVHEEELEKASEADLSSSKTDGPSVSQGLQRALQQAALQMSKLKGEGVMVSQCDASTGTATTRLVPHQEFVDGKAID